MPFMLYNVSAAPVRGSFYHYVRTVSLAGKSGPLARIQRNRNSAGKCPFTWHVTAADIVAAIGGQSDQEIVIDLKPTVTGNVSLYRLLDIWGFSYAEWTPLAVRLECLFAD